MDPGGGTLSRTEEKKKDWERGTQTTDLEGSTLSKTEEKEKDWEHSILYQGRDEGTLSIQVLKCDGRKEKWIDIQKEVP